MAHLKLTTCRRGYTLNLFAFFVVGIDTFFCCVDFVSLFRHVLILRFWCRRFCFGNSALSLSSGYLRCCRSRCGNLARINLRNNTLNLFQHLMTWTPCLYLIRNKLSFCAWVIEMRINNEFTERRCLCSRFRRFWYGIRKIGLFRLFSLWLLDLRRFRLCRFLRCSLRRQLRRNALINRTPRLC